MRETNREIYPESFTILSVAVPGPGNPKGGNRWSFVENSRYWVILSNSKPAGKDVERHLDPST